MRPVRAHSQHEQRRATVSAAIGQGLFQRPVRIQPQQVLVAELENINLLHHAFQARHIGVTVRNQNGAHIRVHRGQDAACPAICKAPLPGGGIGPVDQGQSTNMQDAGCRWQPAVQLVTCDLPFGGTIAVKGIAWHALCAQRYHCQRCGLHDPRCGDGNAAFDQAGCQQITQRIARNRGHIGNIMPLPASRHSGIERGTTGVCNIGWQPMIRRGPGHKINQIFTTNSQHILHVPLVC